MEIKDISVIGNNGDDIINVNNKAVILYNCKNAFRIDGNASILYLFNSIGGKGKHIRCTSLWIIISKCVPTDFYYELALKHKVELPYFDFPENCKITNEDSVPFYDFKTRRLYMPESLKFPYEIIKKDGKYFASARSTKYDY